MKTLLTVLLIVPLTVFAQDYRFTNEYYDYPSYRAFEYSRQYDSTARNQAWQRQMDLEERHFDYQLQQNRGFNSFENQLIFGDGFTDGDY